MLWVLRRMAIRGQINRSILVKVIFSGSLLVVDSSTHTAEVYALYLVPPPKPLAHTKGTSELYMYPHVVINWMNLTSYWKVAIQFTKQLFLWSTSSVTVDGVALMVSMQETQDALD